MARTARELTDYYLIIESIPYAIDYTAMASAMLDEITNTYEQMVCEARTGNIDDGPSI